MNSAASSGSSLALPVTKLLCHVRVKGISGAKGEKEKRHSPNGNVLRMSFWSQTKTK